MQQDEPARRYRGPRNRRRCHRSGRNVSGRRYGRAHLLVPHKSRLVVANRYGLACASRRLARFANGYARDAIRNCGLSQFHDELQVLGHQALLPRRGASDVRNEDVIGNCEGIETWGVAPVGSLPDERETERIRLAGTRCLRYSGLALCWNDALYQPTLLGHRRFTTLTCPENPPREKRPGERPKDQPGAHQHADVVHTVTRSSSSTCRIAL